MNATIDLKINRPSMNYSIEIGKQLTDRLPDLLRTKLHLKPGKLPKIFLLTHLNLNALYGRKIVKSLEDAGFTVHVECLNTGESIKTWQTAEKLLNKMIELELNRSTIVMSLGGGVIGDLAGFVSAIYQRGTSFVQVPTSLLAMVDASAGGKVAVNLGLVGKNLIGAFHQPDLVVADLQHLKSLPEHEWKAGLSEVIKYAFIKEDRGAFYSWLMENKNHILKMSNIEAVEYMVAESIRTKAGLVAKDEQDKGARMLLNLGHTFGHSLEAASRYFLAHGEAVSIGMNLAATLSLKLGKIQQNVYDQIITLIKFYGLSSRIEKRYGFTPRELMRYFKYDKKAEGNTANFVIPTGKVIGRCEIIEINVEEKHDLLTEVFESTIAH